MPAQTGPEEMLGSGVKPPLRRESRPSAGACACVAAVLAAFATMSTSMIVGQTDSATYSMGPFAVSSVRLATLSTQGTILVASGTATFGSVDDTACLDETINTTIPGTTISITVNNYEEWAYPYGFCDEPNGHASIPAQARALQAFTLILGLCGLVSMFLLCGMCSFKRRSRPFSLAAFCAASGALAGILAIAQISAWRYSRDLRAGTARMPVRIEDSMYGLEVSTELSFGPGFVGLMSSTLIIIITAMYSFHARNEIRRDLADEEDVLPPVPGSGVATNKFARNDDAFNENADKEAGLDHTSIALSAV